MTTLLVLEFASTICHASRCCVKLKLSENLSARIIKAILLRQFKSTHEQKEKLIKNCIKRLWRPRDIFFWIIYFDVNLQNGHIYGHLVPRKLRKGNLHYLSIFSGKVLLKFCLIRHKTHSIFFPKCANSKMSEYKTFWMLKFKAERKSVLPEFQYE